MRFQNVVLHQLQGQFWPQGATNTLSVAASEGANVL
jgi:hypothetical protein